jgi:hypothetical protein
LKYIKKGIGLEYTDLPPPNWSSCKVRIKLYNCVKKGEKTHAIKVIQARTNRQTPCRISRAIQWNYNRSYM